MKKLIIASIAFILLSGCATQPQELAIAEKDHRIYKDWSCDEIVEVIAVKQTRINVLYDLLKDKADADAAQMTIGLVLFWPTLFFLEGGDGVEAQEYSNLRGEINALRVAYKTKDCAEE